MTSIRSMLCTLGCCFFITTSSAFADIFVDYTLTAGNDIISFSLPQLPAVQAGACVFISGTNPQGCFTVFPVSLTVDGTSVSGNVKFYDQNQGGGLTVCATDTCFAGTTALVNNNGPSNEQLFSGTLANPSLETFSNLLLVAEPGGDPVYDESFTLNAVASGSVTPEPGSYAALTLGLGGVLLAVKSRRAKQRG
jgi:hypothetical protein